jgi:hypothetical protein
MTPSATLKADTNLSFMEPYPKHGRDPPPDDGDRRSDYGTGAGDGGEMMPENYFFFGGHVIHTIL